MGNETTSGCIGMAIILIMLLTAWGMNFNKLTKCDFESPYRCEVIHGIGIIPMVSVFTVWYDTDVD